MNNHHPHVIQPFEIYKNRSIFYLLGNFFFGFKRENFSHNYQYECFENYGDFGLGVVYDTETLKYITLILQYDRTEKSNCVFERK